MTAHQANNEASLVCASRNGDKEALRLLLMENWSWLKAIVYNIIGKSDEIDDVLQNICLGVIANIKGLRDPRRFRPWLAVLARREALSNRQKKNRKPSLSKLLQAQSNLDTSLDKPLEQMVQQEQYKEVLEAINALPDKYREVMLLKYTEDMTYNNIAEILDVPVTTVQIRLVRARRMVYEKITAKPIQNVSQD